MTVPALERARRALAAGDVDVALEHLAEAERRTRSLQKLSINWITSLLSFIGRELGEDAVERALRAHGDELLRQRRPPGDEWWARPAEERAAVIAAAMVANGGACEIDEDDEKITLRFRCGSGGRLIDEGWYETDESPGQGYLVLRDAAPRTFGRDRLPVYCAHCAVNNELQPIEWDGAPVTVEEPPAAPGEACIHRIYRDRADVPAEVYVRLGVAPRGSGAAPPTSP